jgi:hypothetical protein
MSQKQIKQFIQKPELDGNEMIVIQNQNSSYNFIKTDQLLGSNDILHELTKAEFEDLVNNSELQKGHIYSYVEWTDPTIGDVTIVYQKARTENETFEESLIRHKTLNCNYVINDLGYQILSREMFGNTLSVDDIFVWGCRVWKVSVGGTFNEFPNDSVNPNDNNDGIEFIEEFDVDFYEWVELVNWGYFVKDKSNNNWVVENISDFIYNLFWNGSIYNSTVNKSINNSTVNGSIYNSTVNDIDNSTVNGIYNSTVNKSINNSTVNGSIYNSTVNNIDNSTVNGIDNSTVNGNINNSTVNGSIYNSTVNGNIDNSTVNGSIYNSTVNDIDNSTVNGIDNSTVNDIYNSTVNGIHNSTVNDIYNSTVNDIYNSTLQSISIINFEVNIKDSYFGLGCDLYNWTDKSENRQLVFDNVRITKDNDAVNPLDFNNQSVFVDMEFKDCEFSDLMFYLNSGSDKVTFNNVHVKGAVHLNFDTTNNPVTVGSWGHVGVLENGSVDVDVDYIGASETH